jgi:hypothetical protein
VGYCKEYKETAKSQILKWTVAAEMNLQKKNKIAFNAPLGQGGGQGTDINKKLRKHLITVSLSTLYTYYQIF